VCASSNSFLALTCEKKKNKTKKKNEKKKENGLTVSGYGHGKCIELAQDRVKCQAFVRT
jgi:hypothetical protein